MNFRRVKPTIIARHWVESYWIIESDNNEPHKQKIIPDGYPEMVFHFADLYRINISGEWEPQAASLVAGQITKHFYLQNTGRVSILGIKLQPCTLAHLFSIDMYKLTDKVLPIEELSIENLTTLEKNIRLAQQMTDRIDAANKFFESFEYKKLSIHSALEHIWNTRGTSTVEELSGIMKVSERQVERQFQKLVGLSPKFYCRIIRFNAIFQLMEQRDPGWAELAYDAGFADQSHFIRNFKAFTGEDPTAYGFDEKTLANFFLKKV